MRTAVAVGSYPTTTKGTAMTTIAIIILLIALLFVWGVREAHRQLTDTGLSADQRRMQRAYDRRRR